VEHEAHNPALLHHCADANRFSLEWAQLRDTAMMMYLEAVQKKLREGRGVFQGGF
jgi:hypothetical protein